MIPIDQERITDIFLQLVRINAVSKQEKPVADYIRSFLDKINIGVVEDCAGKIVGGSSGNIIAAVDGSLDQPPVALFSHMDTVKPTEGIAPSISDGRIITDGTTILGADNRAGVAILLYSIEYLRQNRTPHIPFEAIFTIGEETGFYGSSHLDLDKVRSRQAFVFDSSAPPGSFVYSAPGAVGFNLELLGKASHAAVNPAAGVNAISMAADLIYNFPVGQVDDQTTINFGRICGGEANNIVPPEIRLTVEIRSFDPEKIRHYTDLLTSRLDVITGKYHGSYTRQEDLSFPGFTLDLTSGAIRRTADIFRKFRIPAKPMRYHGGSDANILNSRGINAINLGIGAQNPHSVNEYITLRDLVTMCRFCLELCGVCTEHMN